MARGREEERKNVHEAVETLRIAWDELCAQFEDLTIEQRIAIFDVFIGMTTPPITIPIEAEEEYEVEEQYGWVRKDGGVKRKRK